MRILSFFVLLSASVAGAADKIISDSLVQNLNCRELSKEKIFSFVNKERFLPSFHIPVTNFSSRSSAGQCWAFSRAQRMISYLGVMEAEQPATPKLAVLDLIRGYRPVENAESGTLKWQASPFETFNLKPSATPTSKIDMSTLRAVETQNVGDAAILRSFDEDIQHSQTNQSFGLEAMEYSFKVTLRSRDREGLKATAQKIVSSLDEGWMPMGGILGFSSSPVFAHAILFQSYEALDGGKYLFRIYDSNSPGAISRISFDPELGFKGDQATQYFPSSFDVVIVNQWEKGRVQGALYNHYRKLCNR